MDLVCYNLTPGGTIALLAIAGLMHTCFTNYNKYFHQKKRSIYKINHDITG